MCNETRPIIFNKHIKGKPAKMISKKLELHYQKDKSEEFVQIHHEKGVGKNIRGGGCFHNI
ncbi:hypothetical protein HZS_1882 [Henneguya salminicola]|nr:hypothetical protein HZS_1882 [Henneguya salminicola]